MRLRRLNLIRYGHFTDFALDFGERPTNNSDFHIIFGENEAGKSTAFNGYLDFLFGIEERTKYCFLHDYNALRIGAVLEIDNTTVELVRIKRRNGNLLGENDQPIGEKILTSALQGLSRDGYQMMFSLDDETIQLGGEEILASKGDFGRLLFAGTTGLADLSKRLEVLKERADSIYSERSRTSEIISLQQNLKQLKEDRKKMDIQVSIYERLAETLQSAEKAYADSQSKRDVLRNECRNLNLLKDAIVKHDDLKVLENELAPIVHLPNVPIDWIEEVRDLQKKLAVAKGNQDDAQTDIDNIKSEIENLPTDPLIIGMYQELEEVATLAVFDKAARKCLPELYVELSKININLEGIRERLGAGNSAELTDFVISDDMIASLDTLLQKEAQLMQRLDSARQEVSDAKVNLSQLREDEKKAGPPDEKVMELVALFDRYAKDDIQLRLDFAEKTLSGIRQKLKRKIEELVHWTGNRNDFKSQNFPTPEQTQRWREKAKGLKEKLANKKMQHTQCIENRAILDSRVKTLLNQLGAITDSCAAKVRNERDNAWIEHRTKLDNETADAFEKVLADDDHIRNERLAATDRLSQFRIAELDLSEIDGKLNFIVDEINRIESDIQRLQNEIRPVFLKAGLPEEFQVEDLAGWLESVRNVRDLVEDEDSYCADLDQIRTEYNVRRTKLLEALTKVRPRPSEALDLKELCEITKPYRDEAIQSKARYDHVKKTITDAESQVQRREKNFKSVEAEVEHWQNNWKDAIDGCWFELRNVDQIRALLNPLRNLVTLVTKQKTLTEELSVQETNCDNFRNRVRKLIHTLGLEEQNDLSAQFSQLQLKLKEARNVETLHDAATSSFSQAKVRLIKAEKELSRIEIRLKEMAAHFPILEEITTLDHIALLLDQVKKKHELVKDISEKERRLLGHITAKTRADADAMLETKTIEDIETRLAEIDGDCKEAEQEFERRIAERQDAFRSIEAIGCDAGVTRLNEEYQSILLEIANKTDRALALHLGLMTADLALMAYRDRHRSDLLKQTADVFSAITAGDYTRLTTQPGQKGDLLFAVRSDGRSITVNEMSKSASFQMYLALRLAAYRWFCSKEGTLPFIGDDIMETFDDYRMETSIRQLSEIAKVGQVLYFTHHRHLCDIAKNVCGNDVVIHEIPKHRSS